MSGWKTHTQMQTLKVLSLRRLLYLLILQIFDLGRVVAVSLAMAEHFEARHADRIDHRASVGEELHVSDLQHAAMIGEPYESNTVRLFTHHVL